MESKALVEAMVATAGNRASRHLPYRGVPRINAEPINALFWDGTEERYGAEVYIRGPGGVRGGELFAAVRHEPRLTADLDRVALDTIARALRDGDIAGLRSLPALSVNISPSLLVERDVERYLSPKKFDLSRVVFELPERLTAAEQIAKVVHLRKRSPHTLFALDDIFATNYNHFPLLTSVGEIHYVKIDWRFFKGAFRSGVGRRTLRIAIKGLLDKGRRVVVEGVNDFREKRFLANLLIQGQMVLIQGNELEFAESPASRCLQLIRKRAGSKGRRSSRRQTAGGGSQT